MRLVLLLVLCLNSWGAIAHVQSASNSTTGATSAVTITVTAGSLLHVSCSSTSTNSSMAVSDDRSQSYTSLASTSNLHSIHYFANAAAGSTTITCTMGGSPGITKIAVEEYSGVATSSPTDGTASCGTTSYSTSHTMPSITTTQDNSIVIGSIFARYGDNPSAAGGYTARTDTTYNLVEDIIRATAGSGAPTSTNATAAINYACTSAFKEGAGGGSSPVPPRRIFVQ